MAKQAVKSGRTLGYALAVAGVGLAFAVRHALDSVLGDLQAFSLFFVPVLLAAWFGGVAPGLVALVCGGVVAVSCFVEPRGSFGITATDDVVAATIYALVGLLVVYVIEWMRRTEEALRDARAMAEVAASRERDAREAAEAASCAKDAFLAVVSHELRGPLSPILVWSRLLQRGGLDAEQTTRALETIERSAKSQAHLVEDLLDLTRIVAGRMRLDVRPVDLVPVIQDAIDIVRPAAEAKGIRLQAVLDGEVGLISGDAERLQQVVSNLLSNAVKFTPQGGRVRVALERVTSHAEIVVADSGRGISAAFLPHVFERFEQAERGPSRARGGLGLGLAIVRHLVALHGGTVRAESPGEGRGAIFTVTLPLIPVQRTAGEATRSHPTAGRTRDAVPPPTLWGVRALVVDDDPDSNETVRVLLGACGADVRVAGSATQAREVIAQWAPDVLVSDIHMPGEDGCSLLTSVRTRDAALPAIALTADASNENRRRLLAAGYQAHVTKPLDPAELVAVVASVTYTAATLQ